MASVDLVFRVGGVAPTGSHDLVFGASEALEVVVSVQVSATLPPLQLAIDIDQGATSVAWVQSLPALQLQIDADYDALVLPDFVSSTQTFPWQEAAWQEAFRDDAAWNETVRLEDVRAAMPWHQGLRVFPPTWSMPWHQGLPVFPPAWSIPWQQAAYLPRYAVRFPWRDAALMLAFRSEGWRQANLNQGAKRFPWQQGNGLLAYGSPLDPPGESHYCYIPALPANLVFEDASPLNGNLNFYCELHPTIPPYGGGGPTVVTPIRKVYIVLNSVNLTRVSDGLVLPCFGIQLSIDAASWTWGFNATLPGSEYANVQPDSDGTPVELEATINGHAYRVLAENLATDRTFGRKDLKIGGRGKNAILDAPYAQFLSFNNVGVDRTAAQLMDDALSLNGVSLGWTVDFQLDDWLVSADAWAHQGSHITAVNAIAAAAGGYVQPHPVDDALIVLAQYPVLPWNWATDVTPDFELPAAVTTQESITYVENARYNRVFVSGQAKGSLVRVTRTGTAGDVVAPMITDALIADEIAGRQRGALVLGNTGRIANVSLRLPVLDTTGIIQPGKFVSYVDGATTRLGIVRSTSVDANLPEVWQTIGVETHE